MKVEEFANTLRFTITPPAEKTDILPENRKMTIKFRDILAAKVTVNGEEMQLDDCVLTVGQEEILIELTDLICMTNPDKQEMEIDLLTRVQGSNHRKDKMFKKDQRSKLPGYLKDALAELDAMK